MVPTVGEPSKADSMMREINEVLRRFGVSRGIGFVPDALNVAVERRPDGGVRLHYREEFTYLPPDILSLAVENAVTFLTQVGVPKEKIRLLGRGVEVELEGDPRVLQFPMLELMLQDRRVHETSAETLGALTESLGNLSALFDFAWDYGPGVRERWDGALESLSEILEEHPEIQKEIEEVMRRHGARPQGF